MLLGPEPDIHKAARIVDAVMEGGDYAFVKFVEALDESEQFTAASLIQKGGIFIFVYYLSYVHFSVYLILCRNLTNVLLSEASTAHKIIAYGCNFLFPV